MAESPTEPTPGRSGSSGGRPAATSESLPKARVGELQMAVAIMVIVAAVFVWWAWKQGAYFGSVFLPGAIVLYGLLIVLLSAAPFRGRITGPARLALAAIVLLAGWTLLSIAWTSDQEAAVQSAQHAILYAAAFGLGIWICNLARNQVMLPLSVVAATGAAIGIVTTVTLAGGTDLESMFHADATLRFPIGYRNAEGAFLLICFWPLVALAAEGQFPWQLRALLAGAATMVLELAVLAQSRGSLPAAAAALVIFIALSPRRLRAGAFLCLVALPVLPALPTLLDVFQHADPDPGLVPLMRDAARAIALTSVGSALLAAFCIRGLEFRLDLGHRRVQTLSRIAAVAAIALLAVGGTVFVAQRGGPAEFLDQRITEFERGGNPDLAAQGARFGVNVGTNRGDFWRVALDEAGDNPLVGGGSGSFAVFYLRNRDSVETPRDPHSVEMLMLSELGIVGLALFGTFVVAAATSALRSRRLGRPAAALTAGSLTAGAYWLLHASYDWFWNYPALTAPVMFLLGAAAAPSLFDPGAEGAKRIRYVGIAALAVAVLISLPLFLSQRYANHAYDEYPGDAGAALSDLDRAADLDPFDPQPLLGKGVIESRLGREDQALESFREAIDRMPEGYAGHFFLARELAAGDRAGASAEAQEALRLNPLDPQVRRLAARLQRPG